MTSSEKTQISESVPSIRVERAALKFFKWEGIDSKEIAAAFNCDAALVTSSDVVLVRDIARRLSIELTSFALKQKHRLDIRPDSLFLSGFYSGVYKWHDFAHCLVECQAKIRRGENPSFIPLLAEDGNAGKINDESLQRIELHTHLWRSKEQRTWSESIIFKMLRENPNADFNTIYGLYMDEANKRFTEQVQTRRPASQSDVLLGVENLSVRKSRELGKKMKETPEPGLLERMQRIFDGYRAGNKRILLDEFLVMARETMPGLAA